MFAYFMLQATFSALVNKDGMLCSLSKNEHKQYDIKQGFM